MKNIFEVLKQKEAELQQLQRDIEALHTAARLLSDESDLHPEPVGRPAMASVGPAKAPRSKEANTGYDPSPRQFP